MSSVYPSRVRVHTLHRHRANACESDHDYAFVFNLHLHNIYNTRTHTVILLYHVFPTFNQTRRHEHTRARCTSG